MVLRRPRRRGRRVLWHFSVLVNAFVLDPARVYVNHKDKYPCGTVEESESEALLSELEALFGSLEVDGRKVVRDMYRKEQLYSGPYVDSAPDLILVGAEGFNLKGSVKAEQLASRGVFTGKHTQDTAFLVISGALDETVVPEVPTVSDVRGIIEKSTSRA